MGSTLPYKQYTRTTRDMAVEEVYNTGMFYTNNALSTLYAKTLVNYDYKDDGTSLVPRGGLQTLASIELPTSTKYRYPLASFSTNINLKNNKFLEDYRARCFLVTSAPEEGNMPEYSAERKATLFNNADMLLYIQDPVTGVFKQSMIDTTTELDQSKLVLLGEAYNSTQVVHGLELHSTGSRNIIYTTLANVMYIPYRDNKDTTLHMGRLVINNDDLTGIITHYIEPVIPTDITVKEVISGGYNMLSNTPYTFSNKAEAGYSINGILPYTAAPGVEGRELLLNARLGQTINFECIYSYKTDITKILRAKWEWSSSSTSDWVVLQTEALTNTAIPSALVSPEYVQGAAISLAFQPTVKDVQIRVSLYECTTAATPPANPIKVMILPIYTLFDTLSSAQNTKPVVYRLPTMSGMTTWKQHVIIWGVTGAENILFTSDTNNPNYFPYPNNIDIFDEAIVHVAPYLDNLLVFTATNIYLVTASTDGVGFTTKILQNRLSIESQDKHVIQVIKNMVFFKSASYYYMIVPKLTSLTGELTVAPVSKPIVNLFNDFEASIRDILDTIYFKTLPNEYSLTLRDYYNFIDNTTIRNVYSLEVVDTYSTPPMHPFKVDVMLNYDTTLRAWTMYMHQSNGATIPFRYTITDTTTLLDVCNVTVNDIVQSSTAQLIKMDSLLCADNFKLNPEAGLKTIPNYQLLDSGYRQQGDQYKKRYREIQMKFNNISKKVLSFYADFLLDDDLRKSYYTYEAKHIEDLGNPNYGLFYIEKQISPTLTMYGTTTLGGDTNEYWTLDFSKFPDMAATKVRFPVSGKGYAPRLKLISYNELPYELTNINWVFRSLYGR